MNTSTSSLLWNPELIRKYDLTGPRYTSYPTAVQFQETVNTADWANVVEQSNQTGKPLSLYFHIPFCDTVCFYCGCNRIVTANKSKASPYIDRLLQEFEQQASSIDSRRLVKQIHWGGGTPTFLSDDQIRAVMDTVKGRFPLASDDEGEYSIEIHPASVNTKRIRTLRNIGFNRLSMGLQDFDPSVQNAVNRFNSVAEVERLFNAARLADYSSISVDLIYGLPKQNQNGFQETLKKVIELSPDRISLFNYAHMPHLFKMQKRIDTRDLPEPQEKLEMFHQSIDSLTSSGYSFIGMDHFAKKNDELALAQKEKRLHRNFQGYSTHNNCDLFAFGVSSISSILGNMFQNKKSLDDYYEEVDNNRLPIDRGILVSEEDLLRKSIINNLMCNFMIDKRKVEQVFNIDFDRHFKNELLTLNTFKSDNLMTENKQLIQVLPQGRILIRKICMVFDQYVALDNMMPEKRYSRII